MPDVIAASGLMSGQGRGGARPVREGLRPLPGIPLIYRATTTVPVVGVPPISSW
jgi:hypothetical protein